ncbi:MAG TPA: alpha/beta hydrolase, partial [Burkholderiaceae bacterium]
VPLPDGPRCHAVAACVGRAAGRLRAQVGDGLVPVDSALGRHDDPARQLRFEADRQVVFERMNHMALLARPEVTQALMRWLC